MKGADLKSINLLGSSYKEQVKSHYNTISPVCLIWIGLGTAGHGRVDSER